MAGSFIVLTAPNAQAQSSVSTGGTTANAVNPARMRRQQQMSPEDAARDQQLQILEARTGNTSLGSGSNGPAGQKQKHGMSRRAPGIDPKGKPLVHEHGRKKKFLLF
jgi:hypothetical protein